MYESKAARQKTTREEAIAKYANRSLNYNKFASIVVVTSIASLKALVDDHAENPKELVAALCQQIRLRKHVYGISSTLLPVIGAKPGATDASESERLRQAFESIVKEPLPAKPPPPTPYPVREAAAAPSALATQLDVSHVRAISEAWRDLIEVLDGAVVLKAPKKTKKRRKAEDIPGAAPVAKRAKSAIAKAPSPADVAVLEGQEFEEDGI